VYQKVDRDGTEVRNAQMLTKPELREDPRNHCVPIIKVIDDPDDDSKSYMVMPLLRNASDPPFQYVKEIIDFANQTLEGLVFLHEKGVAHRDCVLHNFLMDPGTMYPEGFHPVMTAYKPDYSGLADYLPRSAVGVKYYFADFGISSHMPDEGLPRLVTGGLGRDQDPPELSATVTYDPFKLDIFIIGNMLRQEFCDKFSNVEFLRPLSQWMAHADPEQRPTAKEVLDRWLETRETVSVISREWRPCPRTETVVERAALDAISLYNISAYFARAAFEALCRR